MSLEASGLADIQFRFVIAGLSAYRLLFLNQSFWNPLANIYVPYNSLLKM